MEKMLIHGGKKLSGEVVIGLDSGGDFVTHPGHT